MGGGGGGGGGDMRSVVHIYQHTHMFSLQCSPFAVFLEFILVEGSF